MQGIVVTICTLQITQLFLCKREGVKVHLFFLNPGYASPTGLFSSAILPSEGQGTRSTKSGSREYVLEEKERERETVQYVQEREREREREEREKERGERERERKRERERESCKSRRRRASYSADVICPVLGCFCASEYFLSFSLSEVSFLHRSRERDHRFLSSNSQTLYGGKRVVPRNPCLRLD